MEKGVIICVDDDQLILHALRSQLGRELEDEYELEMCADGNEAFELIDQLILEEKNLPVVVTDQIMPGMKGNELLRQLYRISPDTCGILLTGQADAAAVGDAVNNAKLYRYMSKPWDSTDLVLTVKQAILKYEQKEEINHKDSLLQKQNEELEKTIQERTFELQREREKTESLLRTIIPEETAKELKETGRYQPRHYNLASVLFTDFKGFTKTASEMEPVDLLNDLSECFNAFDEITDRHNMGKIKTIGDAYMCAGGLPEANDTNPVDAVYAAWSIREWVNTWNTKRLSEGKPNWDIRIGVHTGEVVAGVIGKQRLQYDLWGDAVNVASRMESTGEPGKINISAVTYELVKNHFECEFRGEIEAKNRGKIGMYFVNSIK